MSIDKRSKGVYRFRVQYKKHSYTTTFYGTEKQAKLEHEKFKIAIKSGSIKQESTITLGELWDMYLKNRNLKATTLLNHNTTRKSGFTLHLISIHCIEPQFIIYLCS